MVLYKRLDAGRRADRAADRQLRRRLRVYRQRRAGVLFPKTNHDAPRGRVIAIDITQAGRGELEGNHSAGRRRRCTASDLVGDRFFADYLKDAHTQVKVFDVARQVRARGGVARARHRRAASAASARTQETFYSFDIVHHAADDLSLRRRRRQEHASSGSPRSTSIPTTTRPNRSSTRARTAREIPMFISYKKGLEKDGRHPTFCTATAASTSR